MTSKEIRELGFELPAEQHALFVVLREIAAQLAELNATIYDSLHDVCDHISGTNNLLRDLESQVRQLR